MDACDVSCSPNFDSVVIPATFLGSSTSTIVNLLDPGLDFLASNIIVGAVYEEPHRHDPIRSRTILL